MSLHWFDTTTELMAQGADTPGMNVFPLYSGPYALVKDALKPDMTPGDRLDVELVNARIYKVTMGSDEYAAVVLCRMAQELAPDGVTVLSTKPQWTIYCGDKQVQGEFRNDGKTLAAKVRKEGKVSDKLANALVASDWVAKMPTMGSCGFFKMLQRGLAQTPPVIKFCSHTKAALANMPAPELDDMATELTDWLAGADATVAEAVGAMSPEEIAFYDAAFIQHVALFGERGAGKTFLARKAADKYGAVYLEMQMHASMEAWEFRSHDRAFNGKVYTVQGPFAQAVEAIKSGKKVVLCMDEFLNMNPMYTNVINSPLSLTDNDTYLINTGSLVVDEATGLAKEEIVEVPANMFWVVATSNIGARYNLDKMTPSVRARFQIILMNTNTDRTKSILEKNLGKYDMPMDFAEMFKKFIDAANQAVAENTLDEEATTRLACNVIRSVHLKAERDKKKYTTVKQWMPVVKTQLMAEIAQVVNFELGPLDTDQQERYKAIVDASFKAPK